MEVFEDFSRQPDTEDSYALIPKREYNPELSAFANMMFDLEDFKDRVRPMANDVTLFEAAH
jgi:hypothetical protein